MKKAKRSIIISAVLAIMMCASLIVGGTLALFTSNSKVNIVVSSANVDVAADVTVAEKWHKDGGATVTGSLYDTGSVEVANGSKQVDVTLNNFVPTDGVKLNVALTNNSTVKVKYRVILSANRESGTELLDALKINVNGKEFRGYTLASEFLALEAETSPVEPVAVTIEFPEDATEGMNMSCSLTIKVEAQQGNAVALNTFEVTDGHTVIAEEVDGVNWYSEVDNATLLEEVKNGAKLSGNLTLTEDVDLDATLVVADNTSVEITSYKTVSNTNDLWDESKGMWSLVSARGANTTLTINGGDWNAKENDCYAVDVQDGANVVIKGGNFLGNITAIYVYEGSLTIEGGFFDIQQLNTNGVQPAYGVLINCYDANHKNGTANVTIKGGTFVNFNPAENNAEGAHTNFVADGYKSVATKQANGDVWYTVVEAGANGLTFTDGEHVLNENVTVGAANGIAVKASGANTKLTIEDGFYNGGANGNNKGIYVTDGATVTIKNGTFTVGSDAEGTGNSVVETNGGKVIIEGGFFYTDFNWNGFYYVLNQKNNNPGTITVKGGTFVNYDPSKGDDNLKGNFVAVGYKVKAEAHGEDTWYIVTAAVEADEDGKISASDVADVIASATTDDKVTVVLPEGTVKLKGTTPDVANKDITFVGNGENTVYDNTPTTAGGEHKADYSLENASVTFKNMTINFGNADFNGFIRAKNLYFENCKIIGRGSYWGVGAVVFKNCEFTAIGDYCLWLYSGSSFTFEDCTFNSDIGKFVNAYITEAKTTITPVDFTNCTFNGKDKNKPAVCLKSYANAAWRLSFSGCTLNGLATDSATKSDYYSVETGYQATTTVTIDGMLVWENGLKNA